MSTEFSVESDLNFDFTTDAPGFVYDPEPGETVVVVATGGTPGPPGPPGADGENCAHYKHIQNNPANPWIIEHGMVNEVAAVHIVANGEPIMASWIENPIGTVTISFGGPCSGHAILT
ncbi:hypothetical protein BJD55_gp167 [Gordonia phage Yvonnetastic]|uniref:Uncharacterized protein n=1 Tax=Gordonia phage Yvonnetastic TaxID=1821566 RepID=A0A142K916_9CAUD|nr:hypothetical protein BJD55_gp167 [Gordonia phage Yvonnetastic]AMS02599.1 hypothetical protein SEA_YVONNETASTIC_55 [Gordonia phage Yvonnetastic]WKW86031.1 hypothetical protein SEA_JONJAMES_57 [Gordonia Phage JonJames]